MSFDKVDENWTILNSIENSIKSKIEKIGQPISEWDLSINRGLLTGFNDAFIIDENTKNRLIEEDPKSAEIIRPILRGKDIKKYSYEFKNLYIIYVPWHFPLTNDENIVGSSIKAERALNEQYPAIYNHLLKYKKELSNRNKSETGIRYEWYALQRWGAKYRDDFFKQKIVYPCIMAQEPSFALDDCKFFTIAPGNIITGENLKYLCCLLNSDLMYFALRKFYMGGGIEGELKTNRLLILPIKKPTLDENIKFETMYDNLINASNKEIIENQINDLIYQIYNINSHEINYINCTKKGN